VLKETGLLGQEEITLKIFAAKHVMKLEVATAPRQRHYFLQGECDGRANFRTFDVGLRTAKLSKIVYQAFAPNPPSPNL